MNILSIQSQVSYGHVGNAAAVFPMQRLGVEVWPVDTVALSNHPGYGALTGKAFEPAFVADILAGIEAHAAFSRCDGVLSGYVGQAGVGEAILSAVARVKAANPAALYCCDPVIGDTAEGIYVGKAIPEFFRDRAVPAADLATPNHFELEYLAGRSIRTVADLKAALATLGPRVILVTSLRLDDTPDDAIDLAVFDGELGRMRTPLLPLSAHGAGDALAAVFFVHYLKERNAMTALAKAGASIFGVLKRTAEAGASELLLVEAQEEFVSPSRMFPIEWL